MFHSAKAAPVSLCSVRFYSQFIPFFSQQVHIARSSVEPKQTQQSSYPGAPPLLPRLSELANGPVGSGLYLFICFLNADFFFLMPLDPQTILAVLEFIFLQPL